MMFAHTFEQIEVFLISLTKFPLANELACSLIILTKTTTHACQDLQQDVKGFYSETVHLKLHVEITETRLRLRFCLCSRNCLPFLAVFVGIGTVGSKHSLKSEYQL